MACGSEIPKWLIHYRHYMQILCFHTYTVFFIMLGILWFTWYRLRFYW